MGWTPGASEIVRKKRLEGKEPLVVSREDIDLLHPQDMTSLRNIQRLQVAFFTPRELKRYREKLENLRNAQDVC